MQAALWRGASRPFDVLRLLDISSIKDAATCWSLSSMLVRPRQKGVDLGAFAKCWLRFLEESYQSTSLSWSLRDRWPIRSLPRSTRLW